MKLDRNINPTGRGKYALLLQRKVGDHPSLKLREAITELIEWGALDFGGTPDTDFFVIRLKDKYAAPALAAYAMAAHADDPEYAAEILDLSKKAAEHPNQKRPD
jgi:hypothetical protein